MTLEYEQKPAYAFLGLFWAVIADCDINSEVIRCIGSPRFTIWGVYRVICKRHYPGSFKFQGKYINNRNEVETSNEEIKGELLEEETKSPLLPKNEEVNNQDFMYFVANNIPWCDYQRNTHPLTTTNDGQNDIVYLTY